MVIEFDSKRFANNISIIIKHYKKGFLVNSNSCLAQTIKASERQRNRKENGKLHAWNAKFLCLSHMDEETLPCPTQRAVLSNAGLGLKRIKLDFDDKEEEIYQTIMSD